MEQQKAYNFRARPLPESILTGVVGVPEKRVVIPTTFQPFKLLADERMTIKAEHRKQKLKEEENGCLKATTFKARPNTVTYKEPFRPQRRENHASPMMQDQLKGSREALKAVMKQERLWEQEQMEKEAVAKLRREQVHRAHSVRRYKPLKPKAEIPITVPQSPKFSVFRCQFSKLFGNRF